MSCFKSPASTVYSSLLPDFLLPIFINIPPPIHLSLCNLPTSHPLPFIHYSILPLLSLLSPLPLPSSPVPLPHIPPIPPLPPMRALTKLLEELVLFVIRKDSFHVPNILAATGSPDRERQKLIREQNVLKQVSLRCCTVLSLKMAFCAPSHHLEWTLAIVVNFKCYFI